jgi:type II secretory pathway pseudopilin PulG
LRLRIKGWVVITVICVLATMIAGAMIARVKYEDKKEQQAWEEVVLADQELAVKAEQALPTVERYDVLIRQHPEGSPEADALAQQIVDLFPWFRDPNSGQAARLIPVKRMKVLLTGYVRRG